MNKIEIIKTLELCMMAIKAIHPILDEDEPCIAFEAYEAAENCVNQLKSPNKPVERTASKEPITKGMPFTVRLGNGKKVTL